MTDAEKRVLEAARAAGVAALRCLRINAFASEEEADAVFAARRAADNDLFEANIALAEAGEAQPPEPGARSAPEKP